MAVLKYPKLCDMFRRSLRVRLAEKDQLKAHKKAVHALR